MSRIVRFYQYGGPEVLKIEEVDTLPPGPNEITLDIKTFGLNRAEALFRSGHYLENAIFPARLGFEAAGIITALGSNVNHLAVGDAVSIIPPPSITQWGAYGEVGNFPAALAIKHPPSLTFEQAAATWMQYITAWGALIHFAQLDKSDAVIITAASSSVGLAALQIAQIVGATSIAITRTRAKMKALFECGADHVLIMEEEDVAARVREITHGVGARVAFDPVAGPALQPIMQAMCEGGIVLVYGMLSAEPTPFPLLDILSKRLTVHGYYYKAVVGDPLQLEAAKQFILKGLKTQQLTPVIDTIFTLDQIIDAHRYLESNVQIGKLVVTT